jgi:hypothetical protein
MQLSSTNFPKLFLDCTVFCQDYEDFDVANEDDLLEEFLGLPRKNPKVSIGLCVAGLGFEES